MAVDNFDVIARGGFGGVTLHRDDVLMVAEFCAAIFYTAPAMTEERSLAAALASVWNVRPTSRRFREQRAVADRLADYGAWQRQSKAFESPVLQAARRTWKETHHQAEANSNSRPSDGGATVVDRWSSGLEATQTTVVAIRSVRKLTQRTAGIYSEAAIALGDFALSRMWLVPDLDRVIGGANWLVDNWRDAPLDDAPSPDELPLWYRAVQVGSNPSWLDDFERSAVLVTLARRCVPGFKQWQEQRELARSAIARSGHLRDSINPITGGHISSRPSWRPWNWDVTYPPWTAPINPPRY